MMRAWLAMLAAPFLLGCTAQPADTVPAAEAVQKVHPESGLQVIPLTVSQDGKTHSFDVEVAASAEEQRQGLMFRTELGPDEGMLFPSDTVEIRGFWMKNTVIPLDIIFIGPDNRIINIAENVEPYSLKTRYSLAPAAAVLEIPGGRSAQLGITEGALVRW